MGRIRDYCSSGLTRLRIRGSGWRRSSEATYLESGRPDSDEYLDLNEFPAPTGPYRGSLHYARSDRDKHDPIIATVRVDVFLPRQGGDRPARSLVSPDPKAAPDPAERDQRPPPREMLAGAMVLPCQPRPAYSSESISIRRFSSARSRSSSELQAPSVAPASAADSFWRRDVNVELPEGLDDEVRTRNESMVNLITVLRRGPERTGGGGRSAMATSGVEESRSRVRRQLALLFLYPVVYIVVWGPLFASHLLGYDMLRAPQDPFWLLLLNVIFLCAQGAADCVVFLSQERPWRHARNTFWPGLRERVRVRAPRPERPRPRAGRTREEMLNEERAARQRRLEEAAAEAAERRERLRFADENPRAPPLRRRGYRGYSDWWEQFEVADGDDGEEDDDDMKPARTR